MSTESSSSKEDMPFARDRSNSGSISPFDNPLRRTPKYEDGEYTTSQNENEEIENADIDYPANNYFDQFYKDFHYRNRIQHKNANSDLNNQINDNNINEFCNNKSFNENHGFCFITPNVPCETIQIPKQVNLRIGKVIVLLSDLSALNLNGKKVQQKYIHSWKNISQIANEEAKKFLKKFFDDRYKKILYRHESVVPKNSPNINIPAVKSKSVNLIKAGQAVTQKNISNSPDGRQQKVTTNSSNFGSSSYFPPQINVKWTNSPQRNVFSNNAQFNSNANINIFHYIGLGLSPPTEDSLYTLDSKYQKPIKTLIADLNLTPPSLSIFDCDRAAILLDYFKTHDSNINKKGEKCLFSAFFATSKSEQLRIPSNMPQNLFSCILLSPRHAFSSITKIHVTDKSMFKMLLTIFTESIGLDSLPTETFNSIFRGESNISNLWQNFFLAQRLMHKYGLQSQSYPELKDMSEHQLWYQFEYAMMSHSTFSNQSNKKNSTTAKDDGDCSNDEYESDFDLSPKSTTANDNEANNKNDENNFVSNVRRMNSINYTSSIFISSNPIHNLSNMYCVSFDTLENPPSYVTAFIASLIIVPELHSNVMARIARFMSRSPQNCVIMGKVLNYLNLCKFPKDYDKNEESFVDWCCVISGYLLAVPSLANNFGINFNSTELIKIFLQILENKCKQTNKSKSYRSFNLEQQTFSANISINNTNKFLRKLTKSSFYPSNDIYNNDNENANSSNGLKSFVKYSDAICVYLLSILVAVRDCQNSMNYQVGDNVLNKLSHCIYYASPILREWIVIFIHSSFTKKAPLIERVGPIGIHSLAALLLYEKRKFTRAAALTVLNAMMFKENISFNHTLMNCALKAAIDGSYIVRHTFLLCVAYYIELTHRNLMNETDDDDDENESKASIHLPVNNNNNDCSDYTEFKPGTDGQYCNEFVTINEEDSRINGILDDFIKNDSEKFNRISLMFQGIPKLKSLIEFLQNDPYKENRELATMILNGTINSDSNNNDFDSPLNSMSILSRCQSFAVQIHRMAHTLLFSRQVEDRYSIRQRYCDNFFEDDELEMFELVDTNSGPIYTISFDFEHKTFCSASVNGEIIWGENRWKIGDDVVIESICPLRDLAWAAISNEGIVYILRDGQEKPIDQFRPSMKQIHKQKVEPRVEIKSPSNSFNSYQSNQQLNNNFNNNNNKINNENKKLPEIIHGVLCSSPDSPIVFISQGNNEILAWDIEALLLVGRIDVESPPKFMIMINGKLFVALMNGVVLQICIKNGSIEKYVSNSASTSESPSISSLVQDQQQQQLEEQNENVSDNEYDNYDEMEDSDGNEFLNENFYTCGEELILYVKKRNEKFINKNILRLGNHKGLLYSVIDKGPLYFWEDFEFPRQISDDLTTSPYDFLVHPFYPIALILNETPLLIHLYEDAPFQLATEKKNHECTCCCFDGERPLCAIGYDDGSVAVWRIVKPKKDNIDGA